MDYYRATFGGHHCEIAVGPSNSGDSDPVVAWALLVRPDGRLDPIYGERGAFLREYARLPADALSAMRRRLISLFGEEQE